MSIYKRSLTGTFYGLIQFLLNVVHNIILIPIILNNWSKEKYGLWLAIYSFINLFKTLDTGYQSYVSNEFNKLYISEEKSAINLLGSSFQFTFLLGFIQLCIYLFIILFGFETNFIGFTITIETKISIFFMMAMWWLSGGISGLIGKIIVTFGHYNRAIIWGIIYKILEIAFLIIAINVNWPVFVIFNYMAAVFFVYFILVMIDLSFTVPSIFPWWRNGSIKLGILTFKKSIILTVNSFLEQFSFNGILLLVNKFLGVASLPIFSTMRTLSNTFIQINQITLNPLTPDIINYHYKNQKEKIVNIININWFLLNFILIFPLVIMMPHLETIYTFWTNNKLVYDEVFLKFLILNVVIVSYGKVIISYFLNINNFKIIFISNVIRVLILFPCAALILFVYKNISYISIIICISEVVASIIVPIYFLRKQLKYSFLKLRYELPLFYVGFFFAYLLISFVVNDIMVFQLIFIVLSSLLIWFNYKILPENFKSELISILKNKIFLKIKI